MTTESGGSEDRSNRIDFAWRVMQTIFNVLNHTMIVFVAVFVTYKCYTLGNQAITWQILFCALGYQLLMTQSILTFYSRNVWSMELSRSKQRTLHWILQAIGSIIAIIGMIIEFVARYQNSKLHFSSTHSICGLIAGILTLIGMCNGVGALWSVELKRFIRPTFLKLAHNLNGIAAFVLGMTALFYGYDKKTIVHSTSGEMKLLLQAFAIITIVLSLIGAFRSSINLTQNAITKT